MKLVIEITIEIPCEQAQVMTDGQLIDAAKGLALTAPVIRDDIAGAYLATDISPASDGDDEAVRRLDVFAVAYREAGGVILEDEDTYTLVVDGVLKTIREAIEQEF